MRRRTIMAVALLAGVVGYFVWTVPWSQVSPPPAIPAELTDPIVRRAIEKKRLAVTAEPASGPAWGELGMAFESHEQSAEAVVCYRRAMELDSTDPRWPYLLGGQLVRAGTDESKEEAVQLYRRASALPAPSPAHGNTIRLTLADLLTELGRGTEAAPLIQEAYTTLPTDPWAAYRTAVAFAEKGETDAAAPILLNLIQSPYARKKSAIALAELARRRGKPTDAEGFETAVNHLPPDAHWANPFTAAVSDLRRGRRQLMDRYVAQEEAQDNRAAVRTATALADRYPSLETQLILLRALVNADDHKGAVAVADDILRTDEGKQRVTAHSFLGLARMGLADRAEAEGRKADAEKLLAQAAEALGESVRLKADYAPGYLFRAKALLRLGKAKEAEEAARGGVRSRPEEWEGYLVLADVLVAANRKAEAIEAVEQAVKLAHPSEPRPKRMLDTLRK